MRKRFGDGKWYNGTVTAFKPEETYPYHVKFDDGDTETYTATDWRNQVIALGLTKK